MNPIGKRRPGPIALIGLAFICTAVVARTLASPDITDRAPWYVALFSLYIVPYFAVLWRSALPGPWPHVFLAFESMVVLGLLVLNPEIDFITAFYAILAYEAALVLSGRARSLWVAAIVLLAPLSLMILYDPLRGLALGLAPLTFAVIMSALVVVNEELERAREQSRALLTELADRHAELRARAEQIEELAALEERSRLARELHDSVSQTLFSITLNARSALILLERDPSRLEAQLEHLQTLTQSALAEMRDFISKLRPG